VFFGVLFVGALIHVTHPTILKVKEALPSRSKE